MFYSASKVVVEVVPPVSAPLGSGCAHCWAKGYCAVYSLAGPQPPPACPLEARTKKGER